MRFSMYMYLSLYPWYLYSVWHAITSKNYISMVTVFRTVWNNLIFSKLWDIYVRNVPKGKLTWIQVPCADLESFDRGGPALTTFFFSSWGEGGSNYHYKRAITFRWRADDDPTLNAGLVVFWFLRGFAPVLLRNPIFLLFSRGVRTPCHPFWVRSWVHGMFLNQSGKGSHYGHSLFVKVPDLRSFLGKMTKYMQWNIFQFLTLNPVTCQSRQDLDKWPVINPFPCQSRQDLDKWPLQQCN